MSNRDHRYKYVRKVGGYKFQARVYFHFKRGGSKAGTHVNLGLYTEERDAWLAVVEYVRTGKRPAHLLPKYVSACDSLGPDAGRFVGRVRLKDCGTIQTEPKRSPEIADAAMRKLLLRLFGPAASKRFYPLG